MSGVWRLMAWYLAALLAATGCTGPQSGAGPATQGAGAQRPEPVKRVITAIMNDPPALNGGDSLGPGGGEGTDVLFDALHVGLTIKDEQSRLRPLLAESAPTLENGLWKLFPDGRMETTWKIKPNARWHDGASFTTQDLVFGATVHRDRGIPATPDPVLGWIESIETPDPTTVTVRWNQTFIEADALFGAGRGSHAFPLPSHLLTKPYEEDKENFLLLPYWSVEFVGTGPYKLREWVGGSHLLLEANQDYILGRPKINTIEVKFIPDANTLLANIMAGTVAVALGRGLSLEQAIQLRDQWHDGTVGIAYTSWIAVYPQFLNPNPPILANVHFRRALMHALDRQEMVETFMGRLVPIAHAFLAPARPEYKEIESQLVRYEYDPSKAARMLGELGYAKGADGVFRDAAQQKLAFEVRAPRNLDVQVKSLFSVADYWQKLGIDVDPVASRPAQQMERPYRANYPAFEIVRQPNGTLVSEVTRYHGAKSPTAENNYVGTNRTRYRVPEYDALLDRYAATIPKGERTRVLGQILQHMSDQLNIMGLFYDVEITPIAKRIRNVTANSKEMGTTAMWNAHEWSIE